MSIKDIRNYILEEKFQINLTPNYVDIVNYKDIGTIDNKNITIYYESGSIKITGSNMTVSKLRSFVFWYSSTSMQVLHPSSVNSVNTHIK